MEGKDNLLSKDDLFLLLKSYENNVAANTTLLEQTKQVLDKQSKTCDLIDKVISDLKIHSDNVFKIESEVIDKVVAVGDNIIKATSSQTEALGKMKDDCRTAHTSISTEHVGLSKEHIGIRSKVYILGAGLTAVILSLIIFVGNAFSKFAILDAIAKHLGVN